MNERKLEAIGWTLAVLLGASLSAVLFMVGEEPVFTCVLTLLFAVRCLACWCRFLDRRLAK